MLTGLSFSHKARTWQLPFVFWLFSSLSFVPHPVYCISCPPDLAYFLIYAFNPTITGFPSIIAVVLWLPWLEAMTSDLPLADGVGVCISTVIIIINFIRIVSL